MRCYSQFWLDLAAGRATLAAFAPDDALPVEGEMLDMAEWLRLPEDERARLVEAYAARRPRYSALIEGRRRVAA